MIHTEMWFHVHAMEANVLQTRRILLYLFAVTCKDTAPATDSRATEVVPAQQLFPWMIIGGHAKEFNPTNDN